MKSMLKPLLMLGFVVVMVFLMQQRIEEDEQLKEQASEIDPSSVIYSDIGIEEQEKETKQPTDDSPDIES